MNNLRKDWLLNGRFKHNGLTYVKGVNENSANQILDKVEPFTIGQRIYVWDPYKVWRPSKDRPRGGDYNGGRAYGNIISIKGTVAMIKYDDIDELIEEQFQDLRTND